MMRVKSQVAQKPKEEESWSLVTHEKPLEIGRDSVPVRNGYGWRWNMKERERTPAFLNAAQLKYLRQGIPHGWLILPP